MPSPHGTSRLYSMEVDAEINAVRFRWTGQPTGEEFRYGANQLLESVRSRAVAGLLVDARNVTAHQRSSIEWLVREWMPEVAAAGVEYVAVVHEDDLIARTEMEALNERFRQAETAPLFFPTDAPADAREWIAERDRSTTSLYHIGQYLSSLQLFSFS
ncbi:hypothetical protein GGP68_002480 [Salinibacter ruber]|nr:hypothetical protein [Salinibacter ruber]